MHSAHTDILHSNWYLVWQELPAKSEGQTTSTRCEHDNATANYLQPDTGPSFVLYSELPDYKNWTGTVLNNNQFFVGVRMIYGAIDYILKLWVALD